MMTRFGILLLAIGFVTAPDLSKAEVSGEIAVIDGDTFDVDGTRVRLFAIDAPEVKQICTSGTGDVWPCGDWVTSVVRTRFEGKEAICEPIDTDRYGRTVARCFVGGQDIARVLVQEGLAFAYRRYSMDYDFDEKAAAIRGVGIHAEDIQSLAAFQRDHSHTQQAPGAGGVIKGNISAKGTRIYHRPGQRDYWRTRISVAKGERWFCSEAAAEAAGWRAAKR